MNHDNEWSNQQPQGEPQQGRGSGHNQQQDPWANQQPRQGQQRQGKKRSKRGAGNLSSALGPGDTAAADAIPEERMSFLKRTYAWLTGAIFLCVAMMAVFFNSPYFEPVISFMANTSWLLVLALFIGSSWIGDYMAHRIDSKGIQFIGMLVGVGSYAIVFGFLFYASGMVTIQGEATGAGGDVLIQAVMLTLAVFSALTAIVFVTKKDFSALRTGLIVMSVLALGAIGAGSIFGFTLGLGFAVAMVGFSSAFIVYQTSNILHHYPTDRHVGAALALFSSIGMLFWYIFIILGFDG